MKMKLKQYLTLIKKSIEWVKERSIFQKFWKIKMKFNPYSLVLIMVFIITVAITNNTLKKTKQKYEKTNYDSCVCLDDNTISIRKMWLEFIKTPTIKST